jgi:predicted amidophosphoribosyltransferase
MPEVTGIGELIMQLLFPPRCLFCDGIFPIDGRCERCGEAEKRHRLCGSARSDFREKRLGNLGGITASFFYRDEIAELVARYKFRDRPDLFRDMAGYMAADFGEIFGNEAVEAVTCVPSFRGGGGHSRMLALGVAKGLGRRFLPGIIRKIRRTGKQHNLEHEQRGDNIRGAFRAATAVAAGKRILICDDVLTSGNTLNECAAALRAAGAAEVYGCVFSATAQFPR